MAENKYQLDTLKMFAREALKEDTDDLFMKKTQLNALIELIKDYPNELTNIIARMIGDVEKEMLAFGLCLDCGAELEHDSEKTSVDLTYKKGVLETAVAITRVCPKCGRTETNTYTF